MPITMTREDNTGLLSTPKVETFSRKFEETLRPVKPAFEGRD
jgi:hypothetical protein